MHPSFRSSSTSAPASLQQVFEATRSLVQELAPSVVERDRVGGLPKRERDLIRASGLLKLTIPTQHGGLGQPLSVLLTTVRDIARVDPSLAHVFAFHHLMLASVRLYGTEEQWTEAYRETSASGLFWGNALNPRDPRTVLRARGGKLVVDGVKSFCSGAGDSDRLIVSALREDGKLMVAVIPTGRSGVRVLGDWDAIGQRQTDSGTVELHEVEVHEHELLTTPGPLGSPFASLRSCIAQSILVHVYLGIAEGALEVVQRAHRISSDDAVRLVRAGELLVELEGAAALAERARVGLDRSWERGEALSEQERAEAATVVALAKVATTRAGLSVTSRMFELLGARAALRSEALDRFFRNLRTHTLHDPVDEKLRELGAWALLGEAPKPGFYS